MTKLMLLRVCAVLALASACAACTAGAPSEWTARPWVDAVNQSYTVDQGNALVTNEPRGWFR